MPSMRSIIPIYCAPPPQRANRPRLFPSALKPFPTVPRDWTESKFYSAGIPQKCGLSVILSVCLWAGSLQKYSADITESWCYDWAYQSAELSIFWCSDLVPENPCRYVSRGRGFTCHNLVKPDVGKFTKCRLVLRTKYKTPAVRYASACPPPHFILLLGLIALKISWTLSPPWPMHVYKI